MKKVYYVGKHKEKGLYEVKTALANELLKTKDWVEGVKEVGNRKRSINPIQKLSK